MGFLLAFDPTTIITGAITTLEGVLTTVATPALGLGAGIMALYFGWSLVRRFVS